MRRAYHIARADFLQRVRSRKLIVILAVIAYFGYLVNVGQIELAYQVETSSGLVNVHGTNTAEFVGLKAGLTGATVLLLGGFYMMNATLERDRRNNVDRLIASSTLSDFTYLFGKWLSNVALAVVILAVLGFATVVNHLVHGIGATEPIALLGPIVVFALPVAAVVGAVGLVFESVDWLNGTGGNIAYFFLAAFVLAGLAAAEGQLPDSLPVWLKATDTLGQLAVYELTVDALHTQVPTYAGGPPSFGTLNADQTFTYTGHRWPVWIFVQRVWLLIPAFIVLAVTTIPVTQLGPRGRADSPGWLARLIAFVPRFRADTDDDEVSAETIPVDSLSFTPVHDRGAGSVWRLVGVEFRLTVRGRRWWWYAGAALLILSPLGSLLPAGVQTVSPDVARRLFLPLVFIWPIFLWSDIGVRTVRHQMTDLVFSSKYSLEQLIAEWLSGVLLGIGLSSGVLVVLVVSGQVGGILGIVSGVLFAPSLAVAIGVWIRSAELFELTYLLVWYAGPLNGGEPVDFVGATVGSVQIGAPIAFIGLSVVFLSAALLRRKMELGSIQVRG
jgi:hypothetical protein